MDTTAGTKVLIAALRMTLFWSIFADQSNVKPPQFYPKLLALTEKRATHNNANPVTKKYQTA